MVELLEKVRRGHLRLPAAPAQWLDLLESTGSFVVEPLTAEVVLAAESLYAIPERTDRLIAATARARKLPLITRDASIARVAGVDAVW